MIKEDYLYRHVPGNIQSSSSFTLLVLNNTTCLLGLSLIRIWLICSFKETQHDSSNQQSSAAVAPPHISCVSPNNKVIVGRLVSCVIFKSSYLGRGLVFFALLSYHWSKANWLLSDIVLLYKVRHLICFVLYRCRLKEWLYVLSTVALIHIMK